MQLLCPQLDRLRLNTVDDVLDGQIGPYNTQNYSVNHVKMCVKKRSEHLRKEDVRFLSTLKAHLKQGTVSSAVELVQDRTYDKNPEPESFTESCQRLPPRVSWEAYRSWELTGNNLFIGRKPNLKIQSNDIKLTVVMTDDIDFKITYGFPLRIDVPVAPSVTGRVTFNNVELYEPGKRTSTGIILQDEVFRVPVGYVSSEVL
ncbi:hypothetical protein ACTXT7_008301 [Hymenolepis weldensis]